MNRLLMCSIVVLMSVFIGLIGNGVVFAAPDSEIRIMVDGFRVVTEPPAFVEGDRTYVPLRSVLEAYKVDSIDWQAPNVVVLLGDIRLIIPIGEKKIYRNGTSIPTDTAAIIREGYTYLPIRSVIEALGGKVSWEADRRTVVITKSEPKDHLQPSLNVVLVSDVGGMKDHNFNQMAYEGLIEAKGRYVIGTDLFEPNDWKDYSGCLEEATLQKPSLVCAVGFMMSTELEDVAESYPEQKYAIFDMTYGEDTPPNVTGITFRMNEASFLVGYIAGKMTKTNTVGFIGGVDISPISESQYGYMAGVKMANPNCQVLTSYAGSFTDPETGKGIALAMYGHGADIVFHASGATGAGIIDAAKETGKYVIGLDTDQSVLAPDYVLTSAIKRLDTAMVQVVDTLNSGKWVGGTTLTYGLAEGCVDIAPTTNRLVPVEILNELETVRQRIMEGTLIVPATVEEYMVF